MTVVRARGLRRVFPTPAGEVVALDQADLTVGTGEIVAVMGPSGAGKSTLLHLLGLMDRPSAGSYELVGEEVAGATEKARARLRAERIGFVFQAFHLVDHLSCTGNVAMPLTYRGTPRRERARRAHAALERVGMGHRLDARPQTLSGGERQRVAIARALVTGPPLLLCDEPTGNLDSANTDAVLSLLRSAAGDGVAVVLITHDSEVATAADTQVRIVDGRTGSTTHGSH